MIQSDPAPSPTDEEAYAAYQHAQQLDKINLSIEAKLHPGPSHRADSDYSVLGYE